MNKFSLNAAQGQALSRALGVLRRGTKAKACFHGASASKRQEDTVLPREGKHSEGRGILYKVAWKVPPR